ncbi:hypothetical protein [Bacillus chungangensis]|uniref:Uncharacterized protein n=1 Tax=Bacillus chungangensis TaxID=587633 RepID=A0ABT9WSV5_9BACI|nr:hypothetical protein [Bacillus chungangensis]MDQ0175982.1 hypothetical protein [Bacillus chungangensis]
MDSAQIRNNFWEVWNEKARLFNAFADELQGRDDETLEKIAQLNRKWHETMLAFGKVTEARISLD